MTTPTDASMKRDAFIHGQYQYTLSRDWSPDLGGLQYESVCFIMLNPSTADGLKDDPTIRKCIGLTERLGYSKLTVVNLYALRATDPKQLPVRQGFGMDIVGPSNNTFIFDAVMKSHLAICAWGAFDGVNIALREAALRDLIPHTKKLYCLGWTKKHRPRHPLMLAYSKTLYDWRES